MIIGDVLQGNLYGAGFAQQIEAVCDVHAAFRCPYGYTDSYGKRRMKRYDAVEEALTSMKTYCVDKSINIVELFSRFDSDGSMSVTHDEFKLGLRVSGDSRLVRGSVVTVVWYEGQW